MKYIKLIVTILVTVVMTACSAGPANLTEKISFKDSKNVQPQNAGTLKDAINMSGLDILKDSVKNNKNENVIISPLSIFSVFSLLTNGASGETKDEIDRAFYLKNFEQQKLNEAMNSLINSLNNNNKTQENSGFINVYNSVWFDNNFKVNSSFLNTAKSFYDSEIFKKDLKDAGTVKDMNTWVNKKSDGLIKAPFDRLSDEDRMVLVNLLNFKGKWANSFDKSKTSEEDFYLKDKTAVKAPLMNREAMMSYYEDKEVKSCIMNYYNGRMIVLLPNGNIDDYVKKLTNEKINKYTENAANSIVKLKFPKFKVEYKQDIKDTLEGLGIKKAFVPQSAQFNALHDDSDPLWVGRVLHDCVIDVDEEGTSGAALTALFLCGTSLPQNTYEMYVNKPFVFIIQDNSGVNLFMGKIENVNS